MWTIYQPDRELSHLVVLPKSATGLAADALSCSQFDGRVRVTKNLRLFEIAHDRKMRETLAEIERTIASF
jgi:hypothetical protein